MSLAQGTNNENRRAEVVKSNQPTQSFALGNLDDCKKQGEQMFDAMLMM
jgi:hypothetical protein